MEATPRFCSFQASILLYVLPFTNIGAFLWCYTALPLHYLDNHLPIWNLSLLLTFIYLPRVFVQLLTRRVGDWLCVLVSTLAVVFNVVLYLYPTNLTAVWLSMSTTCCAMNPTAYKGLMNDHFSQLSRTSTSKRTTTAAAAAAVPAVKAALRIYTFADTIGYAIAPFIGGVLYDNGGLKACALYAAVLSLLCAVLPLCLQSWRTSFYKFWSRPLDCCGGVPQDTGEENHSSTATRKTAGSTIDIDVKKDDHNYTHKKRTAIWMLMAVTFTNILSYR